jgi:pimeloyl-ACP methyl ester carboxylesterase
VRQALGLQRISLWGISYGTQLALVYAQAFPSHSQRLLLDSVVSPLQPDPFAAETLRRLPARLNGFCEASA